MEEYEYDVFGKVYSKHTNGTLKEFKRVQTNNTRFYTGRELDQDLNLYYHRARYYHPDLGRFISRDPIDIADDVNLYAYVGNSPVIYTDRMGLEKKFVQAYDSFLEAESEYSSALYKYDNAISAINLGLGHSKYKYQASHFGFKKEKWRNLMIEREKIAKELHYNRNNFILIYQIV